MTDNSSSSRAPIEVWAEILLLTFDMGDELYGPDLDIVFFFNEYADSE